ncbi:proton-coupled amino acid transporter-like protein CG1139 isoform X2 [Aethina tumida]|uniref:proton-coupled amino acid transporter-like protein CG1139 isoform X2 n=1 Tax=Aethina tumida TaxID=116153 RepID=UPI002149819F|nr:proton-coupled amino acid transporter-like protein CG1139 isoform X2 [Aethina tumida]
MEMTELKKPQLIAQVDQKSGGVNTQVVMTNYKSNKHEVPAQSANGSTVPLVLGNPNIDPEAGDYDPFQHRNVSHPTSDLDTLIHLLKGSLGSGILSMPLAFANSGLYFGLASTFVVGFICTYCVHMLVRSAHSLCRRMRVPMLGFADVAETAFLAGPKPFHQWAKFAKACINLFLVIDLLGCCCIYVVFVARNVKQVVDYYAPEHELDTRYYMALCLPLLLLFNTIKKLKYLAPFSMIANILMAVGMGITFYYIFNEIPNHPIDSREVMVEPIHWPMFFGTVIFALEGIGVVMPLENNMKNPTHFIGCPSVLNIGMFCVICLYSSVGFFGYWVYGPETEGSITLNLPKDEILAQSVKIMIAIAVFLTYALQFYVPMEIIWKAMKNSYQNPKMAERVIRYSLIVLTVVIAICVPNLGGFISLVGAVCLSMLGMIFPAIIDTVTNYEDPGLGVFKWRLVKNILLIAFGLIGFVFGTYVSIKEIIQDFK